MSKLEFRRWLFEIEKTAGDLKGTYRPNEEAVGYVDELMLQAGIHSYGVSMRLVAADDHHPWLIRPMLVVNRCPDVMVGLGLIESKVTPEAIRSGLAMAFQSRVMERRGVMSFKAAVDVAKQALAIGLTGADFSPEGAGMWASASLFTLLLDHASRHGPSCANGDGKRT